MSTDRDVTRIVRSWLEEGATALPDRVLDNVLDQLPATPQRRAWWPARRFREMNMPSPSSRSRPRPSWSWSLVGINLLPRNRGVGGPARRRVPTPSPTASPSPSLSRSPSPSRCLPDGPLAAGSYTIQPFAGPGGLCVGQPGCTEAGAEDDSIRITVTVPDGWSGFDGQCRSIRREIRATRRSRFALHARRLVAHRLAGLCGIRTGHPDRTEHPDRHDRRRVRDGARGSS